MSGVSGAGRKADLTLLFCECNESVRAYGVPKHRHLSEIEQELSLAAGEKVIITFIPHLIPVNCRHRHHHHREAPRRSVAGCHRRGAGERLRGRSPSSACSARGGCADTKNVTRTNFIDIGWQHDPRTGRVLLMSAEDNLGKGAGGQAVQSFNLMFGLSETDGLQNF